MLHPHSWYRSHGRPAWLKYDCTPTPPHPPHPQGHERGVSAVAWSPDGRWLASGGYDEAVLLWDPRDGDERPQGEQVRGGVGAVGMGSDCGGFRLPVVASTAHIRGQLSNAYLRY